jgi:hypothetical protein
LKKNLKLTIDEQHQPDLDWCVDILSTLNPFHRYFQKHYFPSDEERGYTRKNTDSVSLNECKLL